MMAEIVSTAGIGILMTFLVAGAMFVAKLEPKRLVDEGVVFLAFILIPLAVGGLYTVLKLREAFGYTNGNDAPTWLVLCDGLFFLGLMIGALVALFKFIPIWRYARLRWGPLPAHFPEL